MRLKLRKSESDGNIDRKKPGFWEKKKTQRMRVFQTAALMGLISVLGLAASRSLNLLLPILFLTIASLVYAQETGSPAEPVSANESDRQIFRATPLASEIHSIENIITLINAEANPESRQEAMIRLARLQQLSGDNEAAAHTWLAAAAVPQGPHTNTALVSAAYNLAAMGDWEKASAVISPVLQENRDRHNVLRARYLEACAKAWNGTDASGLRSLALSPDYRELHSVLYYTLWKLSRINPEMPGAGSADEWINRLFNEFPHSPEARIAASESRTPAQSSTNTASAISAKPSPHWLLLPGIDGFSLAPPEPAITQAAQPVQTPAPQQIQQPVQAPAQPAQQPVQTPIQPSRLLQTGLFSVESNAINQKNQLEKAGFPAAILRRTVNNRDLWAVTVPGGTNINQTIENLKKAGFDSFPL
jgi:hypothetical protein